MTGKFVVRFVDKDYQVLAWAELNLISQPFDPASPRTRADFLATEPTEVVIRKAGTITKTVVHWTDADVVREETVLTPLTLTNEHLGQTMKYLWSQPVWAVQGQPGIILEPVTVDRSVTLNPGPIVMQMDGQK